VLYAVRHPGYTRYLYRRRGASVPGRCEALRRVCRHLPPDTRVVVLARSSGGRVASLVADELSFAHVVCMGYPFKHPEHGDEPERYTHLAHLKTPMLILQGRRDVYGIEGQLDAYPMSPQVTVEWVDTGHEFGLEQRSSQQVVGAIERVLAAVAATLPPHRQGRAKSRFS
jgi:hypothetical protein